MPALATARKGGLVTGQEQLEFVAELADLNPEYAVGSVVMDLLQVGGVVARGWVGWAGSGAAAALDRASADHMV
jgi:hypothetical protein